MWEERKSKMDKIHLACSQIDRIFDDFQLSLRLNWCFLFGKYSDMLWQWQWHTPMAVLLHFEWTLLDRAADKTKLFALMWLRDVNLIESHWKYLWCHTIEMDSCQNADWQDLAQTHGKDFTCIKSQLYHSKWNTPVHMYGKHISMCRCVSLDTTDYYSANNKWYLYAKSPRMQHSIPTCIASLFSEKKNSGNVRCIWRLPFHQIFSQYFEWFPQANAKYKVHLLDQRDILPETNMLHKITKKKLRS